MKLNSLHLLLTYKCTFECDHCFVWGSPWQEGTLTYKNVQFILGEARALGGIDWIYFEGGEPTLFYPILVKSVQEAKNKGFQVGIVTNAYWATSSEDALEWLQPFKGLVHDFSISSDIYHYSEKLSQQAGNATTAATELGIPTGVISIAASDAIHSAPVKGLLPPGESGIMFRGRAAEKLSSRTTHNPWHKYTECPYEDLRDPERVHIDPLGYIHICQGITIGNIFEKRLGEIVTAYSPFTHPILSPLILGGPVALVEKYGQTHQDEYADACHLCYATRLGLRSQFPEILAPDQVYGIYETN